MPTITYGTGTPTQNTSGTARQVLELDQEIHYFNPAVTPILTIAGRAFKEVTPVPKFEWQEDEYLIQRSQTFTMASSANLADIDTAGNNDKGSILICDRQSQLELFERGGVYTASVAGSASLESMSAYMCVGIGKEIDHATPTDKMVQLVGFDTVSGDSYTYDEHATTTAILASGSSGTLTLTYVGNAGAGSLSAVVGASATNLNLTNNDVFTVLSLTGHSEGSGVPAVSRKKVRHLENCTQIFKEPYKITGTEMASEMYGPMELDRLQARKLKKFKTDIEWCVLTNGAIDLDATAENPKRSFAGFGVGNSNGIVQSNNGNISTDFQLTEASFTMSNFDDFLKNAFEDLEEGSGEKDMFVSTDWMNAITARVRAEASTLLVTKMGTGVRAGLRVTSYEGPLGAVNFIRHPKLKGALAKFALIVDWQNFKLRPLRTRDVQLQIDIVKDGVDGQVDQWLAELGPMIMEEQTHTIGKLV